MTRRKTAYFGGALPPLQASQRKGDTYEIALIGTGNMPLMQWILDGKGDDAIINMSALARRLECSRSSLLTASIRMDSTALLGTTSTNSDNEN